MTVCAKLHTLIDLSVVGRKSKFNGVVQRMNNSTLLIFANGSIVSVGAKCLADASSDFHDFASIIGYEESFEICIKNVVYRCNLRMNINLIKLFELLKGQYTLSLEPEICPALVLKASNLTLLIHSTGQLIATGTADLSSICDVLKNIERHVAHFNT